MMISQRMENHQMMISQRMENHQMMVKNQLEILNLMGTLNQPKIQKNKIYIVQ